MSYDEFTHLDEEATQFTYFGEEDEDATQFEGELGAEAPDDSYRPLEVGSLFLDKYTILKVLGSGNFGMIYLLEANDASKKLLVVKEFFPKGFVSRGDNAEVIIKPTLSQRELKSFHFMKDIFIGEAKNLVKATEKSHPNIVTFFALEENKNNTTYFIMNYEEGISLKEYLAKHKEEGKETLNNSEVYHIALPLLSGLKQIHQTGVTHQDIKAENILIREDGSPILLDFGASVILYDDESEKYFNAATPRYAAIEQINVDQPPKINQTSDLYAVGVLLYKLVTDTFPPKSKERMDAIVKGKKDPYVPLGNKKRNGYDSHLLKAIDKALKLSQDERFQTAQEFSDALKNRQKVVQYIVAAAAVLALIVYLVIPQSTGKIKLHITQKSYDLYIDGKKTLLEKDGTSILPSGSHKISVNKDGYVPYEKTINIGSDSIVNVSADLTPMQQAVTIESNVDNATIMLNGSTLKNNIFTAHYGETYRVKIIAKGYETLDREVEFDTLANNSFKLYYKLSVNKIKVTFNVILATEMGITKIKINNEPIREKEFTAHKGKTYTIDIVNPYYETLHTTRTFTELYNNPQPAFTLSTGEGTVNLEVQPSNVKVTAYQIIDDQEIKLNEKPHNVDHTGSLVLPAADKLYLLVSKEGYKTVRSRIFSLRDKKSISKLFDLRGSKGQGGASASTTDSKPYEGEMVKVKNTNFSVCKHEVSYEAFARFLNASPNAQSNKDAHGNRLYSGKIFKYIKHQSEGYVVAKNYKRYPVTHISWYGANAYVKWLSETTKKPYALPSQKQWSALAKKGFEANKLYAQANFNSGVLFQTAMKDPNADGIYDLFGNVFEWTSTPSERGKHIIKGGSYRSKKSFLKPHKSSESYNQNVNRADLGFRIIKL